MTILQRLLPVVWLALATSLPAQSLTFGELTGTATGPDRRPVGGAEVRAVESSSGAVRTAATARDGRFRFELLPAGRYDVTVEALGFHPLVHLDVEVAAGFTASIAAMLRPATPPVSTIDTVRALNVTSGTSSWLFDRGYADLLGLRRTGGDAAALTTTADEFGVEGLPWRHTDAIIDGSRSSGIGSPGGTGSDGAGLAVAMRGASGLSVGGLGFDAEVGGTGVGLRSTTRRAGRAGGTAVILEGGAANYGGSLIAGGAIQGDTAQAIFGIDYQRSEVERPSLLGADAAFASALVNAAQATFATDLSAYAAPATRLEQRASGFGRLDWRPSDRLALSVRASGSRQTVSGLPERFGLSGDLAAEYEAIMAQVGVSAVARLTRRLTTELRFSTDVGEASAGAPLLPATWFAGSGAVVGGLVGEPFEDQRTTPRAAGILHVDLGRHRFKTGIAVASHRFGSRFVRGGSGEYRFGDIADFSSGDGAWRRVEGAVPSDDFRMSETAFFVQDAWTVADGFSVTLGARFDGLRYPVGDIEGNPEWLALSGLDTRGVEGTRSRFSPRIGLRWELGPEREWVIEGGAGVFHDLPDRRDLAEALTFDRGAPVRYGVGPISSWPAAPDAIIAPAVGQTLTLLGPDFEGPRTQRVALGATRRLGAWTISFGGIYRYTDFLSRRRDLNLPAAPLGVDQHGRPLYGAPQQVGTLLAAAPRSNRRFPTVDAVHALESSGYSDYRAGSFAIERVRESGLSLGMSYTYSRTTDDVMGFAQDRLSPFPSGVGGARWEEGFSDLDVPHRLLAAAEWSSGRDGAFRLGAVYRLSSGLPFTPGVRGGVDANGDGDAGNDPAFVDPTLPGMDALLASNECLASQAGGFAERNSCRGDYRHRLDVRASFRLASLAVGRVDLVLDALDVIATEQGPLDGALLLVDRTGTISTDPGTGATRVPYVVNPAFGRLLADRSPGVLWRVGLRIVP